MSVQIAFLLNFPHFSHRIEPVSHDGTLALEIQFSFKLHFGKGTMPYYETEHTNLYLHFSFFAAVENLECV